MALIYIFTVFKRSPCLCLPGGLWAGVLVEVAAVTRVLAPDPGPDPRPTPSHAHVPDQENPGSHSHSHVNQLHSPHIDNGGVKQRRLRDCYGNRKIGKLLHAADLPATASGQVKRVHQRAQI